MSDPENWPTYMFGSKELVHALGVITATFNRLEFRMLGLFLLYAGFNPSAAFLFAKLRNNTVRLELLRRYVAEEGETEKIKEAVNHFCDGFDRCAQNRNFLIHSGIEDTTIEHHSSVYLLFSKAGKNDPAEWNSFYLDLPTLRRIADEIYAFSTYGAGIYDHIIPAHHHKLGPNLPPPPSRPLPQQPALPEVLTTKGVV